MLYGRFFVALHSVLLLLLLLLLLLDTHAQGEVSVTAVEWVL